MRKVPNLSHALSILVRAEAAEYFMHADVDAFGAPGECHTLVARGEAQRARRARKHAEAVSQRPYRCIAKDAARRGMPIGGVRWQNLLARVYEKHYPF